MIIFTDKGDNDFILPLLILFYYFIIFFHFSFLEFIPFFYVTSIFHRQRTVQHLTAAAWNQEWKRMTHLQNT